MGSVRIEIRESLLKIMSLLAAERGENLDTPAKLKNLQEEGSVVLFRLVFLLVVEHHGLLYKSDPSEGTLTQAILSGQTHQLGPRVSSLVEALQHNSDRNLAFKGGSIFTTGVGHDTSASRQGEWGEALGQAGSAVLTLLVQYGEGRTQRILGDIYEETLAYIPKWEEGVVSLGSDIKRHDTRSELGAHYTPAEIVTEIVRPALGRLFARCWESSDGDPTKYVEALFELDVCDPAMGTAHFLTEAVTEIAREIVWARIHGTPRPSEWHEPMLHPNPVGPSLEEHSPANRTDDSSFALVGVESYGGKGSAEAFDRAVKLVSSEVARRCVYGVDVNPMSCELGKLSLWLVTAFGDSLEPLSFLEDNFKCGNSLFGVTSDQARLIIKDRLGVTLPRNSSVLRWAHDLAVLLALFNVKRKDEGVRSLVEELNRYGADLPEEAAYSSHPVWGRILGAPRGLRGLLAQGEDNLCVQDAQVIRSIVQAAQCIELGTHLNSPLHWHLDFPHVFSKGGFDAVLANPPFVGDRKLKGSVGEKGVDYLKGTYSNGVVLDLTGYFFWRFDDLVNEHGVFSTLGSNTMAQAKNRRGGLLPLISGESPKFVIVRSRRSEKWPGEASVYICMILAVREKGLL